jgi:hypothetical protein
LLRRFVGAGIQFANTDSRHTNTEAKLFTVENVEKQDSLLYINTETEFVAHMNVYVPLDSYGVRTVFSRVGD